MWMILFVRFEIDSVKSLTVEVFYAFNEFTHGIRSHISIDRWEEKETMFVLLWILRRLIKWYSFFMGMTNKRLKQFSIPSQKRFVHLRTCIHSHLTDGFVQFAYAYKIWKIFGLLWFSFQSIFIWIKKNEFSHTNESSYDLIYLFFVNWLITNQCSVAL